MKISLIIFERRKKKKDQLIENCIQVRCGLSGINEEKNVVTAVSSRRVVLIALSPNGAAGGGG